MKVFSLTQPPELYPFFTLSEDYLNINNTSLVREEGTFIDCMKEFDRLTQVGDELIILPKRLVFIKK